MKRFVTGLVCGCILAFTSVSVASNGLQATIFPSKVFFRGADGAIKELEVSGDHAILNYNNRTYIPLRLFSEAAGAEIKYQSPSGSTGGLHQIEVNLPAAPKVANELSIQDPDGYVKIGQLQTTVENGTTYVTGGNIHFLKDFAGKIITLEAVGGDGSLKSTSSWVHVHNQGNVSPKKGEIRSFLARMILPPDTSVRVVTQDELKLREMEPGLSEGTAMHSQDGRITLMFLPRGDLPNQLKLGKPIAFSFTLANVSGSDMTIKPLSTAFEVYKLDEKGQPSQLIYQYPIPIIQDHLKDNMAFDVDMVWSQRDGQGKQVAPGRYLVKLKRPDKVTYTLSSTGHTYDSDIYMRIGNAGFELEIVK